MAKKNAKTEPEVIKKRAQMDTETGQPSAEGTKTETKKLGPSVGAKAVEKVANAIKKPVETMRRIVG